MMMSCIIAAAIYGVCLVMNGTRTTPDGAVYMAMGGGAIVPRPYALYLMPYAMRGVWSWRTLHALSWFGVALCMAALAERHHAPAWAVVGGLMTLPMMRQSVTWPVLLDMPMMAYALATAVAAPYIGAEWTAAMAVVGYLIHVRTPVWAAVFAAAYVDVWPLAFAVVFALGLAYVHHGATAKHPDEDRIEWLRNPLAAAWAKHRSTLNDARVWVMPWGAALMGLWWADAWAWVCLAVGYIGCIVAQDRVRIYQMAAPALVLMAGIGLQDHAWLLMGSWFINTSEV